jgi:hypothetical protein
LNSKENTVFRAIIACLLWSTTYAGIKLELQYDTPFHFAGVRFIISGLIIIFVADHGARIAEDLQFYSQDIFRIPMQWIGGALSKNGVRIEKPGSQVYIPVTLLSQPGLSGSFLFSKDLLSNESKSFVFY